MNISPVSSASGMEAARMRMDNAANNIANANTRGVAPQNGQAEAAGRAGQAQQAPQTQTTPPPADTYEPTGAAVAAYAAEAEQPDLARDVTDMAAQRNAYDANAAAVRTQNETAGTAIDLIG